jgi:hypothetical protein
VTKENGGLERDVAQRMKILRGVWLAAGWLVAGAVWADVYTWVDASGNVNVSNLAPPAGARVTGVTHENPAAIARAEAARKAAQDAEVRELSDRVAQLERAAEDSARPPPPPMYFAPPAPAFAATMPQYEPPPMPQYQDAAPPFASGCSYFGCPWGFYPVPVVTARRFGHRDRDRGAFPHRMHSMHSGATMAPRARIGAPSPSRAALRRG